MAPETHVDKERIFIIHGKIRVELQSNENGDMEFVRILVNKTYFASLANHFRRIFPYINAVHLFDGRSTNKKSCRRIAHIAVRPPATALSGVACDRTGTNQSTVAMYETHHQKEDKRIHDDFPVQDEIFGGGIMIQKPTQKMIAPHETWVIQHSAIRHTMIYVQLILDHHQNHDASGLL